MDVLFFNSSSEFREWLVENHATASELWVGFYKKGAGKTGISYAEAVDQALCFGWIDGIRQSVDDSHYKNRFTPRKTRSNWSAVNIKRVGELAQLGLMHPSGLKAFNERKQDRVNQYSYEAESRELNEEYAAKLRANEKAWQFLLAQPASYQKAVNWWVMSAKKEETRLKRLATLIEESEQGRKIALFSRPTR